ncbi:unnamed protein product [Meganyctiphanes norvegica]|uniref:C-type lectin domain-containing protein n=1 Tax=Meganyctiphanes norvegica TaxID=48144 RepID=A0AAV2RVD9_MEGNR
MGYQSATKIPWTWYSTIYFLCIVSHSCYVKASNEDIKDALQEFRTFIGEKLDGFESRMNSFNDTLAMVDTRFSNIDNTFSRIDNKVSIMQDMVDKRFSNIDNTFNDTLTMVDKRFSNIDNTFSRIDNKVSIMQAKLDELNSTVVNISTDLVKGHIYMRENITEELNTLSNHVESLIIDDLNSNIVNITEKLAKDHTTTKKCITMQEKLFTEFRDMEDYMADGLINVTTAVKSSIIKELNTNIINISTQIEDLEEHMNASDTNLLNYIKLNNKAINSSQYQWHILDTDRFVRIPQGMNWNDARALCRGFGLDLYKPKNAVAVAKYLEDNFSDNYYWLGARGNGTNQAWVSGGVVSRSDPWYGGSYTNVVTNYCLALFTHGGYPAAGTVLFADSCTRSSINYVLCG